MMLAFGMVAALMHVARGGEGQVIDCAMTDGTALLMSMIHGMSNMGDWSDELGSNSLDTGAHFYDTYETRDGKFISIGSIEPQFYAELRRLCGLTDDPDFDAQHDRDRWSSLKDRLAGIFLSKTRAEWDLLFEHTDVCYAPVLTMREALSHPHNIARETFVSIGGDPQPAPAPRYSVTRPSRPQAAPMPGDDTDTILASISVGETERLRLRNAGTVA